jgi:hypothetical protein
VPGITKAAAPRRTRSPVGGGAGITSSVAGDVPLLSYATAAQSSRSVARSGPGRHPKALDVAGLMAGKHSKRQRARTRIPERRLPGIELVDASTKLAHRVSPDELLAGRERGHHQAFCGARFPAAAMVKPGRGPCDECAGGAR